MKHIFPILGLILLLSSCIKNNPDPAWIQINEWTLESNPNGNPAGELTENLSNAWVYAGNDLVGVFELPCKIPLLITGSQKITVYPTILDNGISATKKIYPFVDPYEVTEELIANETVTINPVTRYKTNANFWIEDFDNTTVIGIEDDPSSEASIQVILSSSEPQIAQSFNGNGFGRINLDETNSLWVGLSDENDPLDELTIGQEAYLEIDYHNTNAITTGLLAVSPSGNQENDNIQMNPQEEGEVVWKKIYINLKEIVGGSDPDAYFLLTFKALLDEEDATGQINIDNIKVVYY